jgi:hypothetical protein
MPFHRAVRISSQDFFHRNCCLNWWRNAHGAAVFCRDPDGNALEFSAV